jgi:DNA-binding NarL/FixJ family response regulator
MANAIQVALVNDYEIVLEGLLALLNRSERGIQVVEIDVRKRPIHRVDITLVDTFGEVEGLAARVRALAADPDNGAIIVFSFSDHPLAVRRAMRAGADGFISKAALADQILEGIAEVARGGRVVLTQRSQRATLDDTLRWPGRDIGFTQRDSKLLALLPTGMTNRELGAHLYVSENTIKS